MTIQKQRERTALSATNAKVPGLNASHTRTGGADEHEQGTGKIPWSRDQVLEYIGEISGELARLAADAQCNSVSERLQVACNEARQQLSGNAVRRDIR
ncbi:MAG TPA: hypothetical protein VMX97_12970 [Hyphomicrobiaceae bacterium]|nr:hypothetical protein [Hyphomicrobiaceae bacterium]